MKPDQYYFAYGANTNLASMAKRCYDARYVGQATLPDYKLVFRKYLNVEENPGSKVEGALWKVSARDIKALDWFEGYPDNYSRKILDVVDERGKIKALIYIMNPAPYPQYVRTVVNGYRSIGLPIEQLDIALNEAERIHTHE